MNLSQYLEKKQDLKRREKKPRQICFHCKKPKSTCYCAALQPITPPIRFVILMHKAETRRSVATGRMAHLSLSGSLLFEGTDFSDHAAVNSLIQNPQNYPVVLTLGAKSINISKISEKERGTFFPEKKQPVIFVLDGTWSQARRMLRLSKNLKELPSFCFTPPKESRFIVRKQPQAQCFSTIEAIHHCLELFEPTMEKKDLLLSPFQYMVLNQLDYEMRYGAPRRFRSKRGVRESAEEIESLFKKNGT